MNVQYCCLGPIHDPAGIKDPIEPRYETRLAAPLKLLLELARG